MHHCSPTHHADPDPPRRGTPGHGQRWAVGLLFKPQSNQDGTHQRHSTSWYVLYKSPLHPSMSPAPRHYPPPPCKSLGCLWHVCCGAHGLLTLAQPWYSPQVLSQPRKPDDGSTRDVQEFPNHLHHNIHIQGLSLACIVCKQQPIATCTTVRHG